MTKVIAIDCDEVIADSMIQCLIYHNYTIAGQDIDYNTVYNYHLEDNPHLDITTDEAVLWFDNFLSHAHDDIQPVLGAYEKIRERKEAGHKIVLVTARGEKLHDQTTKWINLHFPLLFDDMQFGNLYADGPRRTKAQMCAEIGADVLIDDNMRYLFDAQEHHPHMQLFLYKRPRNQEYDANLHAGITKVKSWEEIVIS